MCVSDKFPKAKRHFLVLPRSPIKSIAELKAEHVPLLRHMKSVSQNISEEYIKR